MGNNYDIILIGLVAVFLILRLRSVLGKRTGNERPPARDPFTPPAPPTARAARGRCALPTAIRQRQCRAAAERQSAAAAPVASPTTGPGGIRATVLPTATAGVAAIRAADPSFEPIGFTAGARAAFTTIVEAFAKGDTATLRPLLDGPTYASFEAAIRGRAERKEKAETTLIGFEASDIAAAELQGSNAVGHGPLRQRTDQRHAQCRGPDHRRQSQRSAEGRRSLDVPSRHQVQRSQLAADQD